MTPNIATHPGTAAAERALSYTIASWFLAAIVGQWMFTFYIAVIYGGPFFSGDFAAVNQNAQLITGHVAGDGFGNAIMFAHILPAALLSLSGMAQLLPWLRRNAPRVHRWNGRLFLAVGCLAAITGFYLTWGRGSRLSDLGAIGLSINGLLIPIAAAMAWYHARGRRFAEHSRWAIRTFFLINGVWTFRLMLMAWYLLNQGPNGNTKTLDGPADLVLSVACYALPLAIAECVFWAQRHRNIRVKWTVATLVGLGAVITTLSVFAATLFMWMPRISSVLGGG